MKHGYGGYGSSSAKKGKSGGYTKTGDADKSMISAGTMTGLAHVDSIHYADQHPQHPEGERQQRNQAQGSIAGIRYKHSGPSGALGKNPG